MHRAEHAGRRARTHYNSSMDTHQLWFYPADPLAHRRPEWRKWLGSLHRQAGEVNAGVDDQEFLRLRRNSSGLASGDRVIHLLFEPKTKSAYPRLRGFAARSISPDPVVLAVVAATRHPMASGVLLHAAETIQGHQLPQYR